MLDDIAANENAASIPSGNVDPKSDYLEKVNKEGKKLP